MPSNITTRSWGWACLLAVAMAVGTWIGCSDDNKSSNDAGAKKKISKKLNATINQLTKQQLYKLRVIIVQYIK